MPKDKQIKLDPMEWRDAMKDVVKPPARKKKKSPTSGKPAKAIGVKRARGR
jgi:hypothetical protein